MNQENNLRKLAIYYVEPMLYVDYPHHVNVPVMVHVIGAVKNENYDILNGLKHRNILVRISAILSKSHPNMSEFEELKWEGMLQDWYQTCADVVKDAAGYK